MTPVNLEKSFNRIILSERCGNKTIMIAEVRFQFPWFPENDLVLQLAQLNEKTFQPVTIPLMELMKPCHTSQNPSQDHAQDAAQKSDRNTTSSAPNAAKNADEAKNAHARSDRTSKR